jgi:hypothetical protein
LPFPASPQFQGSPYLPAASPLPDPTPGSNLNRIYSQMSSDNASDAHGHSKKKRKMAASRDDPIKRTADQILSDLPGHVSHNPNRIPNLTLT